VAINNINTANKDGVLQSLLRDCIARTSFFTKKEGNLVRYRFFLFSVVSSLSNNLDFPFLFGQTFLEEFSGFIRVTLGLLRSFLILSKAGQCRTNP
jgi:hypothetical protein